MNIVETTPSAAVLLDFDNFFHNLDLSGGAEWLELELNSILSEVLKIAPTTRNINLRLYGGWTETAQLTVKGSQVQQVVGASQIFPTRHPKLSGLLDGQITLATELLALPNVPLGDTRKTKAGLPNIRLASEPGLQECVSKPHCPAAALRKFTKGKKKKCPIEHCTVVNNEAFFVVEQKMVDTMLACDVLAVALEKRAENLIVFSNDFDVIPALAMAANMRRCEVTLVYTYERNNYHLALRDVGLKLHHWKQDT